MSQRSFILAYLEWHYSRAFADIWNTCTNYIWFIYNFFSISLLFRTFFTPWHKMDVQYGKGLDMENFFGPFIVNTLMRLVGMVLRAVIIIIGFVCVLVTFLLGVLCLVIWPFLPFILVYIAYRGLLKI